MILAKLCGKPHLTSSNTWYVLAAAIFLSSSDDDVAPGPARTSSTSTNDGDIVGA